MKRHCGNSQVRREDYEKEVEAVEEAGNFKRADAETLKKRRIIKARRPPPVPKDANPFATIQLAPEKPAEKPAEDANPFATIQLAPEKPAEKAPVESKEPVEENGSATEPPETKEPSDEIEATKAPEAEKEVGPPAEEEEEESTKQP